MTEMGLVAASTRPNDGGETSTTDASQADGGNGGEAAGVMDSGKGKEPQQPQSASQAGKSSSAVIASGRVGSSQDRAGASGEGASSSSSNGKSTGEQGEEGGPVAMEVDDGEGPGPRGGETKRSHKGKQRESTGPLEVLDKWCRERFAAWLVSTASSVDRPWDIEAALDVPAAECVEVAQDMLRRLIGRTLKNLKLDALRQLLTQYRGELAVRLAENRHPVEVGAVRALYRFLGLGQLNNTILQPRAPKRKDEPPPPPPVAKAPKTSEAQQSPQQAPAKPPAKPAAKAKDSDKKASTPAPSKASGGKEAGKESLPHLQVMVGELVEGFEAWLLHHRPTLAETTVRNYTRLPASLVRRLGPTLEPKTPQVQRDQRQMREFVSKHKKVLHETVRQGSYMTKTAWKYFSLYLEIPDNPWDEAGLGMTNPNEPKTSPHKHDAPPKVSHKAGAAKAAKEAAAAAAAKAPPPKAPAKPPAKAPPASASKPSKPSKSSSEAQASSEATLRARAAANARWHKEPASAPPPEPKPKASAAAKPKASSAPQDKGKAKDNTRGSDKEKQQEEAKGEGEEEEEEEGEVMGPELREAFKDWLQERKVLAHNLQRYAVAADAALGECHTSMTPHSPPPRLKHRQQLCEWISGRESAFVAEVAGYVHPYSTAVRFLLAFLGLDHLNHHKPLKPTQTRPPPSAGSSSSQPPWDPSESWSSTDKGSEGGEAKANAEEGKKPSGKKKGRKSLAELALLKECYLLPDEVFSKYKQYMSVRMSASSGKAYAQLVDQALLSWLRDQQPDLAHTPDQDMEVFTRERVLEVVRVHGGEVKERCKGRSLLAWQRFLDFLRDGCLGHGGKDAARQYDELVGVESESEDDEEDPAPSSPPTAPPQHPPPRQPGPAPPAPPLPLIERLSMETQTEPLAVPVPVLVHREQQLDPLDLLAHQPPPPPPPAPLHQATQTDPLPPPPQDKEPPKAPSPASLSPSLLTALLTPQPLPQASAVEGPAGGGGVLDGEARAAFRSWLWETKGQHGLTSSQATLLLHHLNTVLVRGRARLGKGVRALGLRRLFELLAKHHNTLRDAATQADKDAQAPAPPAPIDPSATTVGPATTAYRLFCEFRSVTVLPPVAVPLKAGRRSSVPGLEEDEEEDLMELMEVDTDTPAPPAPVLHQPLVGVSGSRPVGEGAVLVRDLTADLKEALGKGVSAQEASDRLDALLTALTALRRQGGESGTFSSVEELSSFLRRHKAALAHYRACNEDKTGPAKQSASAAWSVLFTFLDLPPIAPHHNPHARPLKPLLPSQPMGRLAPALERRFSDWLLGGQGLRSADVAAKLCRAVAALLQRALPLVLPQHDKTHMHVHTLLEGEDEVAAFVCDHGPSLEALVAALDSYTTTLAWRQFKCFLDRHEPPMAKEPPRALSSSGPGNTKKRRRASPSDDEGSEAESEAESEEGGEGEGGEEGEGGLGYEAAKAEGRHSVNGLGARLRHELRDYMLSSKKVTESTASTYLRHLTRFLSAVLDQAYGPSKPPLHWRLVSWAAVRRFLSSHHELLIDGLQEQHKNTRFAFTHLQDYIAQRHATRPPPHDTPPLPSSLRQALRRWLVSSQGLSEGASDTCVGLVQSLLQGVSSSAVVLSSWADVSAFVGTHHKTLSSPAHQHKACKRQRQDGECVPKDAYKHLLAYLGHLGLDPPSEEAVAMEEGAGGASARQGGDVLSDLMVHELRDFICSQQPSLSNLTARTYVSHLCAFLRALGERLPGSGPLGLQDWGGLVRFLRGHQRAIEKGLEGAHSNPNTLLGYRFLTQLLLQRKLHHKDTHSSEDEDEDEEEEDEEEGDTSMHESGDEDEEEEEEDEEEEDDEDDEDFGASAGKGSSGKKPSSKDKDKKDKKDKAKVSASVFAGKGMVDELLAFLTHTKGSPSIAASYVNVLSGLFKMVADASTLPSSSKRQPPHFQDWAAVRAFVKTHHADLKAKLKSRNGSTQAAYKLLLRFLDPSSAKTKQGSQKTKATKRRQVEEEEEEEEEDSEESEEEDNESHAQGHAHSSNDEDSHSSGMED